VRRGVWEQIMKERHIQIIEGLTTSLNKRANCTVVTVIIKIFMVYISTLDAQKEKSSVDVIVMNFFCMREGAV